MSQWLERFLEISGAQTANTNSHDSLKSFSREDKIIDVTAPIGAIEATGISASSGEKIAEFDIIDVAAINDHYEDKAGIKEFDGKTPRDKAETEAFDAAIENYRNSTRLTAKQDMALSIYVGLCHPAVKRIQEILGGKVKTVTKDEKLLWQSKFLKGENYD